MADVEQTPPPPPTPAPLLAVENAVLTPEQAEVRTLIVGRGMCQAEAARALAISQPAVSQRVKAANKTLRRFGLAPIRRPRVGRVAVVDPRVLESLPSVARV